MNMRFQEGAPNATPIVDEDDPARRQYLEKIHDIRQSVIDDVAKIETKNDNIGPLFYLWQRVRFLTYLSIMHASARIWEEEFVFLSWLQNGDILYHPKFLDNLDAADSSGKSIEQYLAEFSTW